MDCYCRPLESLICQMHGPSPWGFDHSPLDSVTAGLPDSLSHLVENESVKWILISVGSDNHPSHHDPYLNENKDI
jgi:hypothetical protein